MLVYSPPASEGDLRCVTCELKIEFGTQCTNCWEIEHRIDCYLQSEGGKRFMSGKLLEVLDRAIARKHRGKNKRPT